MMDCLQVEAKVTDNAENAYHLACVEALAGNTNEAFAWLESALNRGYVDYLMLDGDPQLTTLWHDPRFTDLMKCFFPALPYAK